MDGATPPLYTALEEHFLGSPFKPGSPANPISLWWVHWAPAQSRTAFYTSNTWGISNFQSSKIVLGYLSEVRDCLSKPSATSRFESLAYFYALSFGKGRRMKPHFQLPYFIMPQIQNHCPPQSWSQQKAADVLLAVCYLDKHKLSKEPSWGCPFTVSVLSGGSYTSMLHTGSLLVANPYLALSWDPWVLVAYATDQRFLWDLLENINSAALIQKRCFLKVSLKLPEKISPSMVSFGNCGTKTVATHFLFFRTQIFHLRDSKIA